MMFPRFKAEQTNGDGLVEGNLLSYYGELAQIHNPDTKLVKTIDIETLLVSLDGFTWFDMQNARLAFSEYSKTHGYEGS